MSKAICGVGWLICIALVTGCANFQAAREFSKQGNGIATAVNAEFAFLARRCSDNVNLYRTLSGTGEDLAGACEDQEKALGELAANTLDLFGKYNKALEAIADGANYDLSVSFKSTAGKLKALKDSSGPVIKGESVDVGLKAADLLADVVLQAVRARELRRLVDTGVEDWPKVMSPLKTYFGPHSANATVVPSPYEIAVRAAEAPIDAALAIVKPLASGTGPGCTVPVGTLAQAFTVRCETIRARELAFEFSRQKVQFESRKSRAGAPPRTVKAIHAAIDSWLAAHAALRRDIDNPSGTEVWATLQQLKTHVEELVNATNASK
jgi:hypothetical protein